MGNQKLVSYAISELINGRNLCGKGGKKGGVSEGTEKGKGGKGRERQRI